MLSNCKNIKVFIKKDYESVSKFASLIFAGHILSQNQINLGLATGATPLGFYKELTTLYAKGMLDFSSVTTFNLDEYYPIANDKEQSYHTYMNEVFFRHVNINPANINIPNGSCADPLKECSDYESNINKLGGIDIQLLGIGINGHIGFNEPNDFFSSVTSVVKLSEDTIKANSKYFSDSSLMPKEAITMGIKTIMMAKKIVLLATGESKAIAIKKLLQGEISPSFPASILNVHHDVTIILDEGSASLI